MNHDEVWHIIRDMMITDYGEVTADVMADDCLDSIADAGYVIVRRSVEPTADAANNADDNAQTGGCR